MGIVLVVLLVALTILFIGLAINGWTLQWTAPTPLVVANL